ncbi:MAG: hypothetical protein IKO56_02545, partial [Alphaproteobacteria bacterium]|nr:hypothetical protein [Alphaproteobacteria bacterium]
MEKITKTERIERIVKKLKTRKSKNVIYTIIVTLVVFAFSYRFYMVSAENNFDVFNIIRNNEKNGVPVYVLEMKKTDGILYEPITIKNNRGFISGARLNLFMSGQKIGNCKIVSVSRNIDLDTGMHVVKTSGCANGLQYAENKKNGFYVPVSALHGNAVYVVENDIATLREIVIENRDIENVL